MHDIATANRGNSNAKLIKNNKDKCVYDLIVRDNLVSICLIS